MRVQYALPATVTCALALMLSLASPALAQDGDPPKKGQIIYINPTDATQTTGVEGEKPKPPSQLDTDVGAIQDALKIFGVEVSSNVILGTIGGFVLLFIIALGVKLLGRRRRDDGRADGTILLSDLDVQQGVEITLLPGFSEQLRELCTVYRPSVVRILNHLLSTGLSINASDIHLNPDRTGTLVTIRVHGLLYEMGIIPADQHAALVSRIKVVSELAIYKKNVPQDGRLLIEGSRHTARVSVLPTNHGEKVVMRLAAGDPSIYDVARLGLNESALDDYKTLLNRDQGVIILTGPTGSGKTTTMYASLNHINDARGKSANIVTLEDPIEFDLPGLSQTQIDSAAGLTFALGLRSVLRQDPDVIMLGEIRDEETADNAMRAAMTGHLIFTTVHADNAAGVFGRLIQIGIEPFHLTSAVASVISQRLCRRLCPRCRTQSGLTQSHRRQLELLSLPVDSIEGPFYTAPGCEACLHKGFNGRIAIFEMLIVTDALRDLILENASSHQIYRKAREQGMHTLLDDGLDKAKRGEVTLDDVLRLAMG